MTQIKECGTKATTRKTDKTESISLPARFSEKSVSASKAQPRKNLANGKSDYAVSKAPSPRTEPVKGGKAGKPNDETINIGDPSFEDGRSEEPKREHVNTFVGGKADLSGKPACEQSNTESVSLPKGSEKPVIAKIAGLRFTEVPVLRFTLDWWKVYLDSCATYHTFLSRNFSEESTRAKLS